jgi:antitoxin ParD1/3/4
LKVHIDKEEYSSKSELVNDLLSQAHFDWLGANLEKSEKSGFTSDSKEQILKESKTLLNG